MSAAIDIDEKRAARVKPFRVRHVGQIAGRIIPPRDWIISSVLIRRSITMFSGDGGVGKSLLMMQLQVACALGVDWLGIPTGAPIPSFGFYCEDDDDELDRRFCDICRHYGASFEDVGDKVRYASRVGEMDNELIAFRGRGDYARPEKTATYHQVYDEVKSWGAQLIVLDTLSDIFAGNENIRYQAKTCTTMLRSLALASNGGVILNTHPSKSSLSDGSGFSGSTAWKGGVRNQMFLSKPQKREEDGDDTQTDERVLRCMKSNYGPDGAKIRLRWQDGVFVVPGRSLGLFDKLDARRKLLDAARYLIGNGMYLSADETSRSALVTNARKLPSCRDVPFAVLRDAQHALLDDGGLVQVEASRDRKWTVRVRPASVSYPIERPLPGSGGTANGRP